MYSIDLYGYFFSQLIVFQERLALIFKNLKKKIPNFACGIKTLGNEYSQTII